MASETGGCIVLQGQIRRGTFTMRTSGGYIPALDGLRALGISLVFVHHMITPLPFGGAVGVDIFFVLSGYLITSILLREWTRHGSVNLKSFYLRRAARLYPALLVVLAVMAVPGLLFAPSIKAYVVENFLAVTYTTPLALEVNGTAAWAWRHTWSLGIEELFYLVWPLLLIGFLRRQGAVPSTRTIVAALGIGLLLGGIIVEMMGHHSLLLRSGGLFLGCALALRTGTDSAAGLERAVRPGIAMVGMMLLVVAVALATIEGIVALPVLLTAVGTTCVLAHILAAPSAGAARFLSWGPATYVGRISYELYLWHYPCLIILGWAFDADPLAVAIIAAPMSIGAAALTHRLLAPRTEWLKARVSL